MAAPGSTANGVFVIMPPNSAGVSQTPHMVQCGPQQFGVMNLGNQPLGAMYPRIPADQVTQLRKEEMMKLFLKGQPKTLGAIQILTGLMHFGFGIVLIFFIGRHYASPSVISGYPFWGGLSFIISGSLSVAAENRRNSCLVRGSLGMNITSAIFSAIGIILFLTELIINQSHYINEKYGWLGAANGTVAMLFFITILEFCITVSTSHFACQAIWYTPNTAMLFTPYGGNANVGVPSAPMPLPPPYTNVAFDPKEGNE
ncbi:membrane-spanning 4-domains subfamily A member 15-like isoform X2 [Emydura macquarii macquarii]